MVAFILAKKMQVTTIYHQDDWYKKEKCRMHILGFVYLPKSFLSNKSHQPHRKAFMDHLGSVIIENPEFGKDCQLDDVFWNDIKETLKAMWRKYHNNPSAKRRQQYNDFLAYSKTVFKSYQK